MSPPVWLIETALISIEVAARERRIVAEADRFLTLIRYEQVELSAFASTRLALKLQPDHRKGTWDRCCGAFYVRSMCDGLVFTLVLIGLLGM